MESQETACDVLRKSNLNLLTAEAKDYLELAELLVVLQRNFPEKAQSLEKLIDQRLKTIKQIHWNCFERIYELEQIQGVHSFKKWNRSFKQQETAFYSTSEIYSKVHSRAKKLQVKKLLDRRKQRESGVSFSKVGKDKDTSSQFSKVNCSMRTQIGFGKKANDRRIYLFNRCAGQPISVFRHQRLSKIHLRHSPDGSGGRQLEEGYPHGRK